MNWKKLMALVMVACMVMGVALAGIAQTGALKDGTYEVESSGQANGLKLSVTFADGVITDIQVLETNETPGIAQSAYDAVIPAVIAHNSINVDTVSGATNTSNGILDGVKKAIEAAGGNVDDFMVAASSEKSAEMETAQDVTTDVVVVGAGLAGLTVSTRLAEGGLKVLLLEKMPFAGGNSLLSTGVLYLGGTSLQEKQGIEDMPDMFYEESMAVSGNRRDEVMTRLMADNGRETLDWFISQGVEFAETVTPVIGSKTERAHQTLPGASGLIDNLLLKAGEYGVDIRYNSNASAILTENDRIIGVEFTNDKGQTQKALAKNTVIAAGGYGANPERLAEYTPRAKGVLYAGARGTTGDMLAEMIRLNAQTKEMEEPWLTPTVETTKSQLVTSLVLSKGAFLVDQKGERMTNETKAYTDISNDILALGHEFVYEIFDDNVKQAVTKVSQYIDQGMVHQADTMEALAQATGIELTALQKTIDGYNEGVKAGKDSFGREIFVEPFGKAPFYYITVKPGTILTPGGVLVNENCQVLDKDGEVLEGLYALGESTGGYRAFGYRGGDALAQAGVTGFVAAGHLIQTLLAK